MERVSIANKTLQLETNQLDSEFSKLIDQSVDSLNVAVSISEEVKLLLKLYVIGHLHKNGETIGSKVYRLRLADGRSSNFSNKPSNQRLILLSALNLVFPYILRRKETLQPHLKLAVTGLNIPWLNADSFMLFIKSLGVLNFFAFLFGGRYPTLSERIVRILPVISDKDYYASTAMHRVQMEILNREVIWKELASFLTTVIPLIRTEQIRYKAMQIMTSLGFKTRKDSTMLGKGGEKVDIHKCGICKNQPFNPHSIGCRHIFCYYCIESRHLLNPDAGYTCSKCNYITTSEARRHKIY